MKGEIKVSACIVRMKIHGVYKREGGGGRKRRKRMIKSRSRRRRKRRIIIIIRKIRKLNKTKT